MIFNNSVSAHHMTSPQTHNNIIEAGLKKCSGKLCTTAYLLLITYNILLTYLCILGRACLYECSEFPHVPQMLSFSVFG